MKIILAIISLFLSVSLYGQSIKDVEQSLATAFGKINYWYDYNSSDTTVSPYDSLASANTNFQRLLLKVTNGDSKTLADGSFKNLLDSGLTVSTSEDGLFRIYSWDTRTGGTMRFFKNVFQYKNTEGTFSKVLDSTSIGNYENLEEHFYAVNPVVSGDKTYYVTQSVTIGSSAVYYYRVKVFSIEKYGLNDTAKLIQTKTGIKNELGYDIDLSATVNREAPSVDRSKIGIDYDPKTKTISIPLIRADDKITQRRILYRFNGKYFVKLNSN